ncbi:MAG TPA: exopolysaccharide biosynthesis polyprenyl glycosylphosphotransferase, partial [Verrucomicrobiales bacterium]|nr:exopolysaccharide biosynthesis polyprenyl glycosylphosphotransferase [Verrucomicrobiales bacterium]
MFGLSFWMAHAIRTWAYQIGFIADPLQPFERYAWLLAFVFPVAPLALEVTGFYDRPLLASRRETAWKLARVGLIISIGCIVLDFFFKADLGRSVFVLLPVVALCMVMAKEELLLRVVESHVGQERLRRRLIIAGTPGETARMQTYLEQQAREGFEVVETIPLDQKSVERLPVLLHKYSANAVVLCAQHTVFGLVEKAIQTCELEGVEVWLMADFFKT